MPIADHNHRLHTCCCRSIDEKVAAAYNEMRALRQKLADSLSRCVHNILGPFLHIYDRAIFYVKTFSVSIPIMHGAGEVLVML